MQVILLRDVARLGRKSEVKDVPSGHALNFLIPRKLAVIATPENLKRHNEEVRQHDVHKLGLRKAFEAACTALTDRPITYAAPANAQGHLFKGINADDIAQCLQGEGFALEKHHIVLPHPIKELGEHAITLSQGTSTGVCRLVVVKK